MTQKGCLLRKFAKVFARGINYKVCRFLNRGMNPAFAVLHITDLCNCRCVMCDIWQKKPKNELTIDEIDRLFSSPFFKEMNSVGITGGETFLRRDIREIAKVVVSRLPALEYLSIPTNGYLTDIIVREVKSILDLLDGNQKTRLFVSISLDGIGEIHDQIRDKSGIYDHAINTVKELKKIKSEKFKLNIASTICPQNVRHLFGTYEYFKTLVDSVVFSPLNISGNFYGNLSNASSLTYSEDEKKEIVRFYRKILGREDVLVTYCYKRWSDLFLTGKRGFPCTAGYRMMYIKPDGDVYPCIMVPVEFCLGNIREDDISSIWFSDKANTIRSNLKKYAGCKACFSDCDYYNQLEDEFFSFLFFLLRNPNCAKLTIQKLIAKGIT